MPMKLAIAGCGGRMGQAVLRKALLTPEVTVVAGGVRPGSQWIGQEAGACIDASTPGARLTPDAEELFRRAEAVIDFTTPDHSRILAELAEKHECILVCGTTGLKPADLAALRRHGKKARIVCSPNMSVGVNLMLGLVEKMSAILPPEEWDIEIDEMHHRLKVDAPSGTSLTLGAAAARGRQAQLADLKAQYETGLGARKHGAIGFSVRRGGDVVGDHSVTFAGPGERIELAHRASSRDIYAAGALRAALWAKDQPAGFYTMRDVLGV